MIPDVLVINKATYDGMSSAHKAAFDRLTNEYAARASANFIAQVGTAKQKAKDEGATFIEDVDANAFRSGFAPVVQKYLTTPERQKLYDAIRAVK
jgi:TRAP-type C4-dicarboxylate transport system substrate-binding protein